MDASSFLAIMLSIVVSVSGLTQDTLKPVDKWANKLEEMQLCLDQENATEADMNDFIINKQTQDTNEPLKMAMLCFLKKIEFFDGVSWNREVIAKSEEDRPEMLKLIEECLERDNITLAPQERAYQAQKCVLEKSPTE